MQDRPTPKTNNIVESYWLGEVLQLLRLVDMAGCDLYSVFVAEQRIRDAVINDTRQFPASDFRQWIVEALAYSEAKRLRKVEARIRN